MKLTWPPWPGKTARKAAVADAVAQAERSRLGAVKAAALEAELRQMVAENHFSEAIWGAITGHENGTGNHV